MAITKFEFLKNDNANLYEIGSNMEKHLNNNYLEVIRQGELFLECLIRDIYERENIDYINDETFFSQCGRLVEQKIISKRFRSNILRAYIIRNRIRNDSKFDNITQKTAFKMYHLVLKTAKCYFQYIQGKNPIKTTLEDRKLLLKFNVDDLKNVDLDSCIICHKPLSEDSILCSECLHQTELLDELTKLTSQFGFLSTFTIHDAKKLGYGEYEMELLILDFIKYGLIFPFESQYEFHESNVKSFTDLVEEITEIRKLTALYFSNKIGYNEIKKFRVFLKGKRGENPCVDFHNLIHDAALNRFLKEFESKKSINEIMKEEIISIKEYNEILRNGEYKTVKNKVKREYLRQKSLGRNNAVIRKNLHITRENIDILDNFDNEIKNTYLMALNENKTYDEALELSFIYQTVLDEYLTRDSDFKKRVNEIFLKRKENFLELLKEKGYDNALEDSKLTEEQILKLKKAKRYDPFYKTANNILKEKYLEFRKEGQTHAQARDNCQIDDKTIENWKNNRDFRKRDEEIRIYLVTKLLKENRVMEEVLKIANISQKTFNDFMIGGYDGDERYEELLDIYRQNYLFDQFEEFFENFHKTTEKNALKLLKFNETIFEKELNSNSKLSKRYLELKKDKYVSECLKGSPNKAFHKSGLTKHEYSSIKDDLEDRVLNLKMKTVLKGIKNNNNTSKMAKATNISVSDIYAWYEEGQKGNKKFDKFSKEFDECFISPAIEMMESLEDYEINANRFLSFLRSSGIICKEDIKYWKKYHILENNVKFDILENITFK